MNKADLISHAAIFLEFPESDETGLIAELEKRGLTKYDAERLVAFLPIAFGRYLIAKKVYVNNADQVLIHETGQACALSSEPVYRAAVEIAESNQAGPIMPNDLFEEIAFRSAEVIAVAQAMEQGVNLHGATFQPVELWGYTTFN